MGIVAHSKQQRQIAAGAATDIQEASTRRKGVTELLLPNPRVNRPVTHRGSRSVSIVIFQSLRVHAGSDLIATRAGRKAVVQCKYWRGVLVQPKIIRELIGTKASAQFRADEAILFTYSACTEAALACAEENGVVIRNANSIEETIRHLGIDRFPELLNPEKKLCPKCGSAMVLREGPEKTFWGCSKFGITRCRGVIECYATVPVLVLDRNFEPSNFKGDCKSEIIGNRCP